jgi:nickel-dependent lactate racemase
MVRIPYHSTYLELNLPPGMRGTAIEPRAALPLNDAAASIGAALTHPIASPPLRELAHPGDKVCIVFTDISRPCPDHLLVPALLQEVKAAGVANDDVTLLCGIGLHRPSTYEERVAMLGQWVVDEYEIIDNEPRNPSALVDLGVTASGVPVSAHRAAVEADLLIATGLVEPHGYAGYSGGSKTLAVGAAGEPLIAYTHGPAFLDLPGTRLGRVDGNPFYEAIVEAARRAGLQFILNVVQNSAKQIIHVGAGAPIETHSWLVERARSVFEVPISQQYDLAIAGVGVAKGANLYQATRAASQLALLKNPVIRAGGRVIIPARCDEGPGGGVGEQRFFAAMREAPDVDSIVNRIRREGCQPGEQRAYILAKALQRLKVTIVGSVCPDIVRACKIDASPTLESAIQAAAVELGPDLDVVVLPDGLSTLPVLFEKDD